MEINEMTQCIKSVLETDLNNLGFSKKYFLGEGGRYEWHFRKIDQDIRFMEMEKRYVKITFTLLHVIRPLDLDMTELLPESSFMDELYGFECKDIHEFEKLLLKIRPIILDKGIQWLDTNYAKYRVK